MRIDLQTLRTILRLCKSNNVETSINIFGQLHIEYETGVHNMGVHSFSIDTITHQVVNSNADIKEELRHNFNLEGRMLNDFYRNFMWLDYIEYMDVKVDGYETLGGLMDFLLKMELRNKKLNCLDCLYSYDGNSYGMFSLFKDGTYTKSYYIIDKDTTHVKIYHTGHEELLNSIDRFSLVSYSPNYETPTKGVQVSQLSRYCKKVDNFTFNINDGGEL